MGPTTKSENLWRKLNSGQDLVAKDVVRAASVLGLFAGGECSLCFHAFVQASQRSYRTRSYAETFRRGAAMTTLGLA